MNTTSLRSQQSPLVGRLREISILREQFAAALVGRGRVVLISGEAGIGKSRLIAEVRHWAEPDRPLLLEGHCFEPDRSLPYALLLDLLHSFLARLPSDAARYEFIARMPDLARLLPELAPLLRDNHSIGVLDPDRERQRIARATRQFFIQLASSNPLLIVLEDLHWSDDISLDVLLHLVRASMNLPVLILATYRDDEVGAGLRRLLAALDRERLATEIALSSLPFSDAEQLLRVLMDRPREMRSDFAHAIYDLTDGNPFFIEEVIRSLIAAGDLVRVDKRWERRALSKLRIPRSVQDAVLRRSEALSLAARQVLNLAAVAGRTFDFAVLQALTGRDEVELIAAIRELVAAQLVVEESAEVYAFRHALTREAIYTSLLARERRGLHRAIAETKERLFAATPELQFADLSYHFAAGEVWDRALFFGERAGRQALSLGAPRAAVEHFGRALDAAARLSLVPPLCVYRDRGQALALLGEFDSARTDYETMLHLAQENEDPYSEWQAILDLGALWAGYDYARAGEYFERALVLARPLNSLPALAASLTQLGNWQLNHERIDLAERSLQSALAIFEQLNDRAGIARVIDLLGTVSDIGGDIPRMRRRYERATALFRELDDRQGLSSALATMLLHGGAYVFEEVVVSPGIRSEAIRDEAEEAIAAARAIDWRAGEAYALGTAACAIGARGEYRQALETLPSAIAIASEIAHREWLTVAHLCYGAILADLLDLASARESFRLAQALARESGSLHFLYLTTGFLAEVDIRLGDIDSAIELLASVDPELPLQTLGQRHVWLARAQIALARGEAADALATIDRLFATALNLNHEGDIPRLALLRGQCLAALERVDDAEIAFRAALRGATERGLRPLCWRSHHALGHLYASCAHADRAQTEFQRAWEIVEELATSVDDDRLRNGFLDRAATLIPGDRSRIARRHKGKLTAREHDVALLVARGLSNRAIAETLFIGERTVETHVSNLLNKLNFTGRVQIAAWVVAEDLSQPTP